MRSRPTDDDRFVRRSQEEMISLRIRPPLAMSTGRDSGQAGPFFIIGRRPRPSPSERSAPSVRHNPGDSFTMSAAAEALPMRCVSVILLLCSATLLAAQSRADLLKKVAARYKSADTFAVKGTATAQIEGTSWKVTYEYNTEAAQPSFLSLDVRKSTQQVISMVGKMTITQTDSKATDPKPDGKSFALLPLGQSTEVATRLIDAQKTGEETVTIQGHAYACEVIEAVYDYSPEFKPKSAIEHKRLWIAPDDLIVLRETKRGPDGMKWTGEVTSFSFDQPPSERLVQALQRFAAQPKDRSDWAGRAAPDLSLQQLSGGSVQLSGFRGRPVLLDFWGSYCGPCRRTTLHAQDLKSRYESQGLAVLSLTQDTPADAKLWTDHYHVTLPVLLDPDGAAFKAFEVEGVPVAILIDADGKIAKYWVGLDDPTTMDSQVNETVSTAGAHRER
ncbi:TlpA family protein disulfide reductase [Acidobacteria bacterium AB60]|nr:TlpA family protein disulfide reductase [Acidobacteria bacterium AB60]